MTGTNGGLRQVCHQAHLVRRQRDGQSRYVLPNCCDVVPATNGGIAMTEAGSDNGGTVVVPLSGELDMAGAEEMTAQLAAALQPGTRRVAVDLHGVTFIDSSAIGALLQFRLHGQAAGAGLVLRKLPDGVRRVLQIAGVLATFDVEAETEPESTTG
jgi:anti-sigma B factor antagonist